MNDRKRPYTKRKRARSEEETRRKIVEATMALHEEAGPRATTIKAIADRAGVQRLTVYRHFEDETAIFQACTRHWLTENPLPDKQDWADAEDGFERVHRGLSVLYRYYRGTSAMWAAAYRDEAYVPALQEPMKAVRRHLDELASDLLEHLDPPSDVRARCETTIRHAVAFTTWQSLSSDEANDATIASIVQTWVKGSLQSSRTGSG